MQRTKTLFLNENLLNALNYKQKSELKNKVLNQIIHIPSEQGGKWNIERFISKIYNKRAFTEFSFITAKNQLIPFKSYGFPLLSIPEILYINISKDLSYKRALLNQMNEFKTQLNEIKSKVPEIRLWALSKEKSSINMLKQGGIALSESEKKYKTILENINEGYFEFNEEGKFGVL